VEIGTDPEGRSITYDDAEDRFEIGGMTTTVDRIVSYDRGGCVSWASTELREWAYEYDRGARVQAMQPAHAGANGGAEPPSRQSRVMSRRAAYTGYAVIMAWMVLPFVPVVIAGVIASILGSPLDEGSVHETVVFGKDIGQALYSMGVMGWFGLVTCPTGLLALVPFTVAVLWRRRKPR